MIDLGPQNAHHRRLEECVGESMSEQGSTVVPTKDEIKLLPPFALLERDRVTLVSTALQAEKMCIELAHVTRCGFDTESKALFKRGEVSDGPHLIQLATLDKAWVIQVHDLECRKIILQWLCRKDVTKAGFGLHYDCGRIAQQFGVQIEGVLELNAEFRKRGYPREIGAVNAIALLFGQRLAKSKKIATTDWSWRRLSMAQVLYAANDAYAAAVVHHELLSRPIGKVR